MFQFIAVSWDDTIESQRVLATFIVARAREHSPLHATNVGRGFIMLHQRTALGRAGVHLLAADRGCVVGQLFQKADSNPSALTPASLSADESDRIVETAGQHLLENYWGRYIAFVLEPASHAVHILRDPTGALPCFLARHEGVQIAFSQLEDFTRLGLRSLSINWKFIHAFLTGRDPQSVCTGLNEVQQIRQGERLTLSRSGEISRQLAWNPMLFAALNPLANAAAAIEQARTTTQMCIKAWADSYDSVVLRYSAGFDSAVVLSCLRRAKPNTRLFGLHYFDPPASANEAAYLQRSLASATKSRRDDFHLLSVARSHAEVRLDTLLKVRQFPCPQHYRNRLTGEPLDSVLAEERGAVLFDGFYGNQLFLTDTLLAPTDYLFDHPEPPASSGFRDPASDPTAVLWAAFSNALRMGLISANNTAALSPAEYPLLKAAVINALAKEPQDYTKSYWAQQMTYGIAPGKTVHIRGMCLPANMNAAHLAGDSTDRISPLVSQPLMELFLRIPTYVLNHGGLDRGITRAAFVEELPPELQNGSVEIGHRANQSEVHRTVLLHNQQFLFDVLLDGHLAQEQLINRPLAERALVDLRDGRALANIDLLEVFLDAEIWIHSISSSTKGVAS
jgi:asparagine synthase (glutamine-hydrolysing)